LTLILSIVLIVVTTVVIARVCDGFEVAADHLGANMSEGIKGATINAVGSSLPELFTTVVFLFVFTNTSGFAGGLGTTAGSSMFNIMIIPALSILAAVRVFKISLVEVSKKVILRDGLTLIIAQIVLISLIGQSLQWWHGLVLMLIYVAYIAFMFTSAQPSEKKPEGKIVEEENHGGPTPWKSRFHSLLVLDLEAFVIAERNITTYRAWVLLLLSVLGIAVGCWGLVYGCESLGHAMGIKGYFVAVIIAAAASSVPDTILSVKDAKKGNYDDAVSNALGSNIFDICFALGLPLFIYTLIYGDIELSETMSGHISELLILLLLLTFVAFLIFVFGRGLGRIKSWVLLGLYAMFTLYIVSRAYGIAWAGTVSERLVVIKHLFS